MTSAGKCMVEGCQAPVHARGYCRRHYGQIWRKGEVSLPPLESLGGSRSPRADMERLRALERELKKAERMYQVVVGCEGRVKWRREMDAVRSAIQKLEKLVNS